MITKSMFRLSSYHYLNIDDNWSTYRWDIRKKELVVESALFFIEVSCEVIIGGGNHFAGMDLTFSPLYTACNSDTR